ncbi:MAG: hypothetical protein IPG67_02525 [Acidobacteria bacterium]|nr:hypothetical protein [Acidobacteriota bacterium]
MQNTDGKSALGLDANVAAGLAYLPICGVNLIMSIIILVTDKSNKLARFSAFQSLLLIGVLIVGYVAGIAIVGVGAAADFGLLAILGALVHRYIPDLDSGYDHMLHSRIYGQDLQAAYHRRNG